MSGFRAFPFERPADLRQWTYTLETKYTLKMSQLPAEADRRFDGRWQGWAGCGEASMADRRERPPEPPAVAVDRENL